MDDDDGLSLVAEFTTITSAHGLHRLKVSRGRVKQWAWWMVVVAFTSLILWHVVQVISQYQGFNVDSGRQVVTAPGLIFPAVTLCNLRPINIENLVKYPDLLRQLKQEASPVTGNDVDDNLSTTDLVLKRRRRSTMECEAGWHQWGTMCIYVSTSQVAAKEDADTACSALGGSLLGCIESQDMQDYINSLLPYDTGFRYYYISLVRVSTLTYSWNIPTCLATYSNFGGGGDLACCAMKTRMNKVFNGQWFPIECSTTAYYTCMKAATDTSIETTATAQTTQAPTTETLTTEELTTNTLTTEFQTTGAQTTEVQTTEAPTTEAQTTEAQTTEVQTTESPITEAQTTEAQTTETPTTEAKTTEALTTEAQTTEASTTEAQTTESQTTEVQTTKAPTTETPTTEAQTTEVQTTEAPTTEVQTTEAPTTEVQTTEAPTTEAITTEAPTTEVQTTEAPTTEALTTEAKTAEALTTKALTSEAITTDAQITEAQTTQTTEAITTDAQTEALTTETPITEILEAETLTTEVTTAGYDTTTENKSERSRSCVCSCCYRGHNLACHSHTYHDAMQCIVNSTWRTDHDSTTGQEDRSTSQQHTSTLTSTSGTGTGHGLVSTSSTVGTHGQSKYDYGSTQSRSEPMRTESYTEYLLGLPWKSSEEMMEVMAGWSEEERYAVGYSLQHTLVDCKINGIDCLANEFSLIANPVHGNCFMFNSGWNSSHPTHHSAVTGRRHGLHLLLNSFSDQTVSGYSYPSDAASGIRLVIQAQDRMPFPENEGLTAGPGQATSIGFRQTAIQRLANKYKQCEHADEQLFSESNMFAVKYPVKYTMQACQAACFQRLVVDTCGCGDASYMMPHGVRACASTNHTQGVCVESVRARYIQSPSVCHCPPPCREKKITTTFSIGKWPSNVYKDTLSRLLESRYSDYKLEEATRNFVKVEIYYEEFTQHSYTQTPSWPVGKLFSQLGGGMGLWLGCSLVTLAEITSLCLQLIYLFVNKANHRTQTKPQQEPTVY